METLPVSSIGPRGCVIAKFFDKFNRGRALRVAFWKSVPRAFRICYYAAVFALFASIGFVSLVMNAVYLPLSRIFVTVFIVGTFATGYAAVSIVRRFWLIPVLGVAEGIAFWAEEAFFHSTSHLLSLSELQKQLIVLGVGSIVSVVIGYTLFILFFMNQGAQLFRAQTEISLAGEIHRALVPAIHQKHGEFEFYGASVPSGVVGGDLVDVVGNSESWTACIADVSGHGVSAGVLMAMFKTAMRTHAGNVPPETLLQEANRTLYPLKTDNSFITAGVLHHNGKGQLSLALAGHPPLLRCNARTQEVEEYRPADMPVGILPVETFTAISVSCEPGDVLLLLTDGLTEIFDAKGQEMGLEPLKRALAQWASHPLPEVFAHLRKIALDAGPQLDDQTMLLVRRQS
jgi:serine phosphatase RsbU (regulator of sigma subunit)